jgi:hypothetical protein
MELTVLLSVPPPLAGGGTQNQCPGYRQWRICFEWGKNGPANVEIVDYH